MSNRGMETLQSAGPLVELEYDSVTLHQSNRGCVTLHPARLTGRVCCRCSCMAFSIVISSSAVFHSLSSVVSREVQGGDDDCLLNITSTPEVPSASLDSSGHNLLFVERSV